MSQSAETGRNQLSTTYENQLTKPKSILDYVESDTEMRVIIASLHKKKINQFTKQEMGQLIDCIARWRFYVGAGSTSPEELILFSDFIFKQYGQLTTEDIDVAVNLSITGKLDIDAKCYTFSPQYCSAILNSYIDYKAAHVTRVMERKDKAEQIQMASIKPTAEDERATMIEILTIEYQTYKETGLVSDSFSIIYNHLKKTGRLKFKKPEVDEALAYGQKMASDNAIKHAESIKDYLAYYDNDKKMEQKDRIIKKYARNFCVQKYFESIQFDELVKSLELSEFQ